MSNRVFTPEFKVDVARRIIDGESVSALHQQFHIKRSILYRWRDAYRKDGAAGLQKTPGRPPGVAGKPRPTASPQDAAVGRIAELERKIGQHLLSSRACRFSPSSPCSDPTRLKVWDRKFGENSTSKIRSVGTSQIPSSPTC